MGLPRMRTIEQCIEYAKSIDPDTALTKTALRRLVTSDKLKHVNIGNKYLVNLDVLESYLSGVAYGSRGREVE